MIQTEDKAYSLSALRKDGWHIVARRINADTWHWYLQPTKEDETQANVIRAFRNRRDVDQTIIGVTGKVDGVDMHYAKLAIYTPHEPRQPKRGYVSSRAR